MDTKDIYKIDYLILINKYHKVPKNWEDALRTVSFINPLGEEVIIEEGVEEIHKAAFVFCDDLKRVDLPSTIKNIGQ